MIKLEKNSVIKLGRVRLRVRDIDYAQADDETLKISEQVEPNTAAKMNKSMTKTDEDPDGIRGAKTAFPEKIQVIVKEERNQHNT